MNITMRQLLADNRVWLGSLARCRDFRELIEFDLPDIILEYYDTPLTFQLLITLQYRIATALADKSISRQNETIAVSLSSYKNKSLFLAVHNTSEQMYCLQSSNMRPCEYGSMKRGLLTVGELYQKNPTALVGPLVPKNIKAAH